jgi:hypothetical protein
LLVLTGCPRFASAKEDLKALVPVDKEIPKTALIERARLNGIGQNRAPALLAGLVADSELFEWRIPRKGTHKKRNYKCA